MTAIIASILGILGPVLAYLVKKLIDNATAKGEAELNLEKKQQAVEMFKEQCLRAVKAVDFEFVLPLKAKGPLTPEQAKQAKDLAIANVQTHYGKEQLVELAMLFSVDAEGLIRLIGDTIEAAILINKRAGSISLAGEVDNMPEVFSKKD